MILEVTKRIPQDVYRFEMKTVLRRGLLQPWLVGSVHAARAVHRLAAQRTREMLERVPSGACPQIHTGLDGRGGRVVRAGS